MNVAQLLSIQQRSEKILIAWKEGSSRDRYHYFWYRLWLVGLHHEVELGADGPSLVRKLGDDPDGTIDEFLDDAFSTMRGGTAIRFRKKIPFTLYQAILAYGVETERDDFESLAKVFRKPELDGSGNFDYRRRWENAVQVFGGVVNFPAMSEDERRYTPVLDPAALRKHLDLLRIVRDICDKRTQFEKDSTHEQALNDLRSICSILVEFSKYPAPPKLEELSAKRSLEVLVTIVRWLADFPPSLRMQACSEMLLGNSVFCRMPEVSARLLHVPIPIFVPVFEPAGLEWRLMVFDSRTCSWREAVDLNRISLSEARSHWGFHELDQNGVNRLVPPVPSDKSWNLSILEAQKIFELDNDAPKLDAPKVAEFMGLRLIGESEFISFWPYGPSVRYEKQRFYNAVKDKKRPGKRSQLKLEEQWKPKLEDLQYFREKIEKDPAFQKIKDHSNSGTAENKKAMAERLERRAKWL